MEYKGIDYENLKEGDLIQFYGVHVLTWIREISPIGIEPTIAFIESEQVKALREQLAHTYNVIDTIIPTIKDSSTNELLRMLCNSIQETLRKEY